MEVMRMERGLSKHDNSGSQLRPQPGPFSPKSSAVSSSHELYQQSRGHSASSSKDDSVPVTSKAGAPSKPRPPPIKTGSSNAVTRRNKAQSMSFPILLSTSPKLKAVSASSETAPKSSRTPRSELPSPTDAGFLTALAAQERQVLELKEELQKAEECLAKLKKQWVSHEATKRRNESAKLHQMQPLSPRARSNTSESSPTWMQEEMERKKAALSGAKSKVRRTFSGSRHTRALSLLSPDMLRRQDLAKSPDLLGLGIHEEPENPETQASINRADTTPDLSSRTPSDTPTLPSSTFKGRSNHDRFTQQSMQMATEFKEGLWTFFEDLRQATYGEEVRSSGATRPQTSASQVTNGRPSSARRKAVLRQTWEIRPHDDAEFLGIENPFWRENGLTPPPDLTLPEKPTRMPPPPPQSLTPATSKSSLQTQQSFPSKTPTRKPVPSHVHIRDFDQECWEDWSTPGGISPARSNRSNSSGSGNSKNSNADSQGNDSGPPSTQTSTSSAENSADPTPRQSANVTSPSKRDSLPWPALNKLRPTQLNLRRTASHLMDEWERSLSPVNDSSGQRQSKHDQTTAETVSAFH
ncbi:MAG: hypothetical protein M1828_005060 [Chrysothrix sp. TS-e1954]|nr:MAG: hypothetical protein M1828_005060 [Chrysothrix sp. TS-e1954]